MKPQTKSWLKRILPRNAMLLVMWLRYVQRTVRGRRRFAGGTYFCPVCNLAVKEFLLSGDSTDCPVCQAGERSRVDWLFLQEHTNLFSQDHKSLLHIAPEMFFFLRLRKLRALDYVTIDLESPLARSRMDITALRFPDERFDSIYCSHVLEHVEDDRKALAELFRVCRPGGWAMLQVPVTVEKTFEDDTVRNPKDRLRVFGNEGHVRRCGPDYANRMRAAGFIVSVIPIRSIIPQESLQRMGITNMNRYVFFCRKPASESEGHGVASTDQHGCRA